VSGSRSVAGARRWHQALAYAITGRLVPELGEQGDPDVAALAEQLRGGPGEVGSPGQPDLRADRPWPHPVPAELMTGLGYAQFAAALAQLRQALGLNGPLAVAAGRDPSAPVSAEERRLLDEVPPHHGAP
jgi:hypothetical protein